MILIQLKDLLKMRRKHEKVKFASKINGFEPEKLQIETRRNHIFLKQMSKTGL